MDPPSSAANMLPSQLNTALPASAAAQPSPPGAASIHPDCLICVSPILHHTIASCAHSLQICATCALRLKLFVKKKKKDAPATSAASAASAVPSASASSSASAATTSAASAAPSSSVATATTAATAPSAEPLECPFCRQAWTRVLFTREMQTEADHTAAMALQGGEWSDCTLDDSIQVYFQDSRTKEQFLKLRSVYCPVCEHQPHTAAHSHEQHRSNAHTKYFASIQALNRHLQSSHSLHTCEACITTRQVFIHEHEFFTQQQLLYHFQHGSPATAQHGPIDPHPFCQFCNQPFFSSDELYAHLSNQHRTCRFCQSEGSQKWYRHDTALRRHFQKQHFLCDQGDCRHREPDYAAYRDAISLRAHQLAAHVEKGSLSQAQLKQMGRVDLSVGYFDHRLPQGGQQGGHGRERQGRREDEYKGRVDGPDYAHDDDGDEEEQYPSLPSAVEQRARQANSNIATKADKKDHKPSATASNTSSASGSTSMQRSYSQPYGLSGRRFDGEDFPTLSGAPSSASSALPAASPAPFASRAAGLAPNPSDFPTLKQTGKSDKKLRALKDNPKEKVIVAPTPVHPTPIAYSAAMHPPAQPSRASSAAPAPAPAAVAVPTTAAFSDTRIMSHVPLPLPAPVPAADVAARNKQLIADIRSSLSADEFDSFRIQSSAYRMGDLTASSYLQFFYQLMRGHENEVRVEQLLIELVALLPDEAKRKELHSAYAQQKVWENIARMKGVKNGAKVEVVAKAGGGGGGGGGVETFQGVPARELKRPVVDEKRDREERERIDREEKERELERKREERKRSEEEAKADKQEKLRVLRDARLKDEAEKERKERERSEKLDKAKQEEADRAAEEEGRRQQEQKQKDEADSARQQQQLYNGKLSKPASKSSAPASAGRSGTMWTSASVDDEDDFAPAFPSATATLGSYSSTSSLSDPALIDTYLGNITQLSGVLPHTMLSSLHFLSNMLLTVTGVLSARHPPSLLSPSLRRFHPSDDTRKRLSSLASRLRLSSALEFGRLTQLGVLPQSIYTLSQVVSLWRRQGGGDDGGGEDVRGVCESMTSGELVVLYEWMHALLSKLSDEQSEDVQAAIERQRRKGEKEQEPITDGDRRLVPLRKDEEDTGGDERKGSGAGVGAGAGAGGKKKGKAGKQLLFYGGSGLSGVS